MNHQKSNRKKEKNESKHTAIRTTPIFLSPLHVPILLQPWRCVEDDSDGRKKSENPDDCVDDAASFSAVVTTMVVLKLHNNSSTDIPGINTERWLENRNLILDKG